MTPHTDDQDDLRPHSYDGIQEYDKKLPNWWLFTLYIAIAYSILHWAWFHIYKISPDPGPALEAQMAENAKVAARNSTELTDKVLWEMSKDPKIVEAGRATFLTTCAACHLPDLSGLVGPNLKDTTWVHSGKPVDMIKIINDGVPAKGMPTWGPILGRQKIGESVAFILSYHKEGEPVTIAPWVPVGVPGAPAAAPAAPAAATIPAAAPSAAASAPPPIAPARTN